MAMDRHPQHSEAGDADTRENPVHTGVTKDTASTPGYFRLFMPGLAARYVPRWLVGAEGDASIFGFLFHNKAAKEANFIIEAASNPEKTEDVKSAISRLEELGYKGKSKNSEVAFERAVTSRKLWKGLSSSIGGNLEDMTPEQISGIQKEAGKTHDLAASEAFRSEWKGFKTDVNSKIKKQHSDRMLDKVLGAGSALLTMFYAYRVSSDIKKVFAETVSYETGKDPATLTAKDFWKSDNVLVQSTVHNFIKKNRGRFLTDAVFFMGPILRVTGLAKMNPYMQRISNLPFSDLGVGIKGAQLLVEIQNKETTVLEYLVQLIDSKLNPTKGIGEQIKPSELVDLYQKWAAIHDPKAAFRDATIYQGKDGMSWAQSEVIFTRVAELLNGTYKYKHADNMRALDDSAPNFALPKFLYLLGHNMIDTYHPERTLAYVEVANRYGIEAVKQVKEMCARDIPLEQVLERFPVSLDLLKLHVPAEKSVAAPAHTPQHASASVPVSFFPAKEASLSHSNQNDAPHTAHTLHQPLTQISDIHHADERVVDPLKEAGRT